MSKIRSWKFLALTAVFETLFASCEMSHDCRCYYTITSSSGDVERYHTIEDYRGSCWELDKESPDLDLPNNYGYAGYYNCHELF